jgi:hypothetical protein
VLFPQLLPHIVPQSLPQGQLQLVLSGPPPPPPESPVPLGLLLLGQLSPLQESPYILQSVPLAEQDLFENPLEAAVSSQISSLNLKYLEMFLPVVVVPPLQVIVLQVLLLLLLPFNFFPVYLL